MVHTSSKRKVSYHKVEIINHIKGQKYEIRYYKRLEISSEFILEKKIEYFVIFHRNIL
jgi:hypothetical protein